MMSILFILTNYLLILFFPLMLMNGPPNNLFASGNFDVESGQRQEIAITNPVILIGNMHIHEGGELVLNSFIMVSGDITIDEGAIVSGSHAWQLNPIWRWVARYPLAGWIWPFAYNWSYRR